MRLFVCRFLGPDPTTTRVAHNGDSYVVVEAGASHIQPVVRYYNKFTNGLFAGLEVIEVEPAPNASAFETFVANCGRIAAAAELAETTPRRTTKR